MEFIQKFKTYLLSLKPAPSAATVKNYAVDVKHFIDWYSATFSKSFSPADVTYPLIEQFKKAKSATYSIRSIERHISSLRKFFHAMKLEGIVSQSPFEIVTVSAEALAKADPYHLKAFKDFLYVYNASNLTIKNYIIDVKQFLSWAEAVTGVKDNWKLQDKNVLSSINPHLVEEYKRRLVEGNVFSASSINRKLSSLRKYFGWAAGAGIINSPIALPDNPNYNNESLSTKENVVLENSVKEEHTISNHDQETLLTSPLPLSPRYSLFPPIRLAQKIGNGINLVFEAALIAPLSRIAIHGHRFFWNLSGKKLFASNHKSQISNPKKNWTLGFGTWDFKNVPNLPKALYNPLSISIKHFSWQKKMWFHIRYTRPNWYRRYHSLAIAHYFNWAILIIFCAVVGFGFYNTFIQSSGKSLAVQPQLPQAPLRILSFQGRLTDTNDNPITSKTNLRFIIYSDPSASSSARVWEEERTVSPDTDGDFSVLMGSDGAGNNAALCNGNNPSASPATGACGIPSTIFAQYNQLWLGVTVENTPELSPRQQLATVAYASNAETLQGLPPITQGSSSTSNTVLALDSSGNLNVGAAITFQASGGQFTLSGNTLALTTTAGSNSNLQLAPDGSGIIDLQKPLQNSTLNNNVLSAAGAVEVDDLFAILATSSGQSALTLAQNGNGPLISASHSGTAEFTLDSSGNGTFNGNVSGSTIYTGNGITYYINNATSNLNALTLAGNLAVNGNVASNLIPNATDTYNLGSNPSGGGNEWNNLYVKNIYQNGVLVGGANVWQRNLGTLSPYNITDDILIGTTATPSAANSTGFQIFGSGPNVATASTSGSLSFYGSSPSITTQRDIPLTIGGNTTGPIQLSPNGTTGLYVDGKGNVGIGTTTPTSTLSLTSSSSISTPAINLLVSGADSGTNNQYVSFNNARFNLGWNGTNGFGFVQVSPGKDIELQTNCSSISCNNANLFISRNSFVGINTTAVGNGQLVVNQGNAFGNGDIFAASASGTTKFVIANSGAVGIGNGVSDATFLSNDSLDVRNDSLGNALVLFKQLGANGDILTASNSAGTTELQLSNTGVLGIHSIQDLDSTAYFLDPAAGTTSLTVAGNVGIGTTNPNNFKLQVAGSVGPQATNTYDLGSSSLEWNNVYAQNFYQNGAPLVATWQRNLGALSPLNITDDVLVGATATPSASNATGFQIFGSGANIATASTSGNLSFYGATPTIQTQRDIPLTIGGATTGPIQLSPKGTTGLYVDGAGNVGIGTTSLQVGLTVAGTTGEIARFADAGGVGNSNYISLGGQRAFFGYNGSTSRTVVQGIAGKGIEFNVNNSTFGSGIAGILTVNGYFGVGNGITQSSLGNAALLVNQTNAAGNGDIFSASTSGTTQFVITNGGTAIIGNGVSNANILSQSALDLRQNGLGNSIFVADQRGTGDIFTASASGTPEFTLQNDGTIKSGKYTTSGGVLFATSNGIFTQTGTGGSNQCLIGGTTPSWGSCSTGTAGGNWILDAVNGTLYPINTTLDVLVGGSSTASAKFSVLNIAGGTPTASVSSGLNGTGTYITAGGNIQTTSNQPLTLGGNTTGAINIGTDNNFRILTIGNTIGAGSTTITAGTGNINFYSTSNKITSSGALTLAGTITANTSNTINGLSISSGALSGVTGYTQASGSFDASVSNGTFQTSSGTNTFNGNVSLASGVTFTQNGTGTFSTGTGNVSINGGLAVDLLPTGNGAINLGSSSHYYNVVYANVFASPVGNGVSGFWTVSNNTNLYPTNTADDLLIGGTGTASATITTPFQIFAQSVGAAVAGTASSSGNLSFRGANTKIDLLNNATLGVYNSVGGNSGEGNPALYIATNGNVGIGTNSPSNATFDVPNGNINVAAGSAASPGYKFTATNTGLFAIGGGLLGLSVNGSERARIDGNGNLGIGISSSLGNKLDVNGSAAFGSYAGTSAPSNSLIVSGNVGIGTSNPGYSLESYMSAASTDNLVTASFQGHDSSSGRTSELRILNSPASTRQVALQAYEGSNLLSQILLRNDTGSLGGISLDYGNNTGLYLNTSGNIGIGTTSPFAKLDINQGASPGTNPSPMMIVQSTQSINTTVGNYAYNAEFSANSTNHDRLQVAGYRMFNPTNDWAGTGFRIQTAIDSSYTDGGLAYIYIGAGNQYGGAISLGTNGNDRLFIDNNGNVGIGTTNPAAVLDVAGAASVSSTLTFRVGSATIQATSKNLLTLGGNTTGGINFGSNIASSIIPAATDTYNLGSDPTTGGFEWNNLYVRQIISPNTGGVAGYWQLNAGALAPTNTGNDLLIGGVSTASARFQVVASGNGAGTISATLNDPKVNNNAGLQPTQQNIINIASADHSYMALTNSDLTIGGHKNMTTINNVQKVFFYDTSKDTDGGLWTNDDRAQASSWYNESRTSATSCVIGTNTRCGTQAFPRKAILVADRTNVYIFDAKDNSLWMEFQGGAHNMLTLSPFSGPAHMTSLYALNGHLYFGYVNSGTSFGLDVIDFKNDSSLSYGGQVIYSSSSYTISQRNTSGSGDAQKLPTNKAFNNTNVNDVSAAVVNGKQYFAVALDANGSGDVVLYNESDQQEVAYFGPNARAAQVWLTSTGTLYATIGDGATPANYALKIKYNAQNVTLGSTQALFDEVYANQGGTTNYGATTTDNNTFSSLSLTAGPASSSATASPSALFVTEGTSWVDGKSDTVYLGNQGSNGSVMAFNLKRGDPSNAAVKYYNSSYITEDLVGDIRGYWPLNETSGNVSDASVKGDTLTTHGTVTYSASGVRGTGVTLDGSTAYFSCTDASCGGTSKLESTGPNWSLGAWIKTSSSATQMIISKFNSGVAGSYFLDVDSGGHVEYSINNNPNAVGIRKVNDGNWHYVVGTFNGSTINIYVDGQVDASQANVHNITDTSADFAIGADFSSGSPTNFFNGSIDEPFVTADTLTGSEVDHMYQVGLRALQNHSVQTLRGASIAADASQKLINNNSNVTAVAASMQSGKIYIGTQGGGVSVIGMDSDTLEDAYSSASTTTDDTGTLWSATGNNNFVQSLSVGQSYGNGMALVFGMNNGGLGNTWMESNDTTLKDFFATNYNPFGATLDQSNLNVDSVLRVTNQISTRLDNLAADATSSAALLDAFRVDSTGNLLSRSLVNSSTAMQFQDANANTILNVDTTGLGKAAITINQQGLGDILTASASGATELQLTSVGVLSSRAFYDLDDTRYFLDPAASATSLKIAGTASVSANLVFFGIGTGAHTINYDDNGTLNFVRSPAGEGGTAATSTMFLDQTGNVGIGTTSPAALLDIKPPSGATDGYGLRLENGSGGDTWELKAGWAAVNNNFFTIKDITANGTRLMIDNNGNVGINTNSPQNKLDISGSVAIGSYAGVNAAPSNGLIVSGNVGIGTTNPNTILNVAPATNSAAARFDGTGDDRTLILNQTLVGQRRSMIAFDQTGQENFLLGTDVGETNLNNFFLYDSRAGATRLLVDPTGNVGIGTTSPATSLDVAGVDVNHRAIYMDYYANDSNAVQFAGRKSKSGTLGSQSAVASGDSLLSVVGEGSDGTNFQNSSYIRMAVDGSVSSGIVPGRLEFHTINTSGTDKEALRIDSSQNVGIGTTSIGARLQVDSSTQNTENSIFKDETVGHTIFMVPYLGSGGYNNSSGANDAGIFTEGGTGLVLGVHASAGGLKIDSTGNVGIDTSNPQYPLDIEGTQSQNLNTSYEYYTNTGVIHAYTGVSGVNQYSLYTAGRILVNGSEVDIRSDERFKEPIDIISPYYALQAVNKLTPRHYFWDPRINQGLGTGFFAQEVQQILPELVTTQPGQYYPDEETLNYDGLIPYAIAAVQGLDQQVNTQFATTSALLQNIDLTSTTGLALFDTAPSTDFTIPHYYTLSDTFGHDVSEMASFLEIVVGNLRAGEISTQQLFTNSLAIATDNVSIAGQQLSDYIVSVVNSAIQNGTIQTISPIASVDQIHTGIISPLGQDDSIALQVGNSKINITNGASGSAVASIDNTGNATFSGTLNSQNLAVNGDATVSGTLHANRIEANSIVGLQEAVGTLSAQNITNVTNIYFATPSGTQLSEDIPTGFNNDSSTNSGVLAEGQNSPVPFLGYENIASYSSFLAYVPNLSATTGEFSQGLVSLGPTSLADTTITGQLSIGAQLILAENSVNVLGADFQIQSLRQGGVSFEGGLLAIDTDGNLTVNGNAVFAKNVAVNTLSPLANDRNLTLQLGENPTSSGAALASSNLSVQNASGSGIFTIDQLGNVIASGAASIAKLNFTAVQPALAVSNTEVVATGSAGTTAIKAHQVEVTIDNPNVTEKSLIYITPVGQGSITPYLIRQVPGASFTVGITYSQFTDTTFNWLIVN